METDSATHGWGPMEDLATIFRIDSIRYSFIGSIFIIGIVILSRLGISSLVYDFSKGNPRIIILVILLLGLIFIKEIYYTGKEYSFVFEIVIISLACFFALIYNKNKQYKNIFLYLVLAYGIYRLSTIYKTKTIEDLIKNLNLGEYDKLSYDILVEVNKNVCEISGNFNDTNRGELTLDLNNKESRANGSTKVCKELIKHNNLNFVTEWEDPISSDGTIDRDDNCDEEWYEQVYDKLQNQEKNCKPGLVCKNSTCTTMEKILKFN